MLAVGFVRCLVIVLGDQLDLNAAAFDDFDTEHDAVWMAEVEEESTHVWSAKQRIALFLSCMRHFALELQRAGRCLHYVFIDDDANGGSLAGELRRVIETLRPQRLLMTAPGDWRVLEAIRTVSAEMAVTLEIRQDRHFFSSVREFAEHARGRKSLCLETFYRAMRRKHGILMQDGLPIGGRWNFDAENRAYFGPQGPGLVPPRAQFPPDPMTRKVLELVDSRFADHPGSLTIFGWPVNREEALIALRDFIELRLPSFGKFQDAMWRGEAWLHHSQLSACLNLKLLGAREVVTAAEAAYRNGLVPLASAEGFIRQILGWREYVRGIYWTSMPDYASANMLGASEALPSWYWTGATEMACLSDAINQTLELGYAHHIQRLMVTGLYALLLGVEPRLVHEWYLAVYVDAVEWVELPNTLGMSQYADAGYMASKPYVASGKYIDRMSNLCADCRYDPGLRIGEDACPFTTLYWDFLVRHKALLSSIPRMAFQLRNLGRLGTAQVAAIAERAAAIRRGEVGGIAPAHGPTPPTTRARAQRQRPRRLGQKD